MFTVRALKGFPAANQAAFNDLNMGGTATGSAVKGSGAIYFCLCLHIPTTKQQQCLTGWPFQACGPNRENPEILAQKTQGSGFPSMPENFLSWPSDCVKPLQRSSLNAAIHHRADKTRCLIGKRD